MRKSNVGSTFLIVAIALSAILDTGSASAAATSTNFDRNLTVGVTGKDVEALQQHLIEASFLKISQPTGYYGNLTAAAVSNWQKTNGIPSTGYFGPISRSRIGTGESASDSSASAPAVASSEPIIIVPPEVIDALKQIVSATDQTSQPAFTSSSSGGSVGGGSISSSIGGAVTDTAPRSRKRGSAPSPDYSTITSTSPANGATDVARNRAFRINFAQSMDASTIIPDNFSVTADGVAVTGSVTYFPNALTAIFLPDTSLPANAEIVLTVSKNVKNSNGVGLADDFMVIFTTASGSTAQPVLSLGSSASYSLLASGLTNTNPTILRGGDLGNGSNGLSNSPSSLSGGNHQNDASYSSADADLEGAIVDAGTRVCDTTETGSVNIGSRTFTPGVHCFTGPVTLTGTTTLSGSGVYIFRASDSFTTSTSSAVMVVGGAQPSSVYWVVSGSPALGQGSRLLGSLLTRNSVSTGVNSIVDGRLLSRSTVTTSATTTVSVPSSTYCSTVSPFSSTSSTVNGVFSVAYIAADGSTVTGEVNGGNCDIALYIPHSSNVTVNAATVHDSLKRGIFVDAATADISSSTISEIGDHTNSNTGVFSFGGTQTGLGIEFASSSAGSAVGNTLIRYQKAGIVARSLAGIAIRNNTVTGMGSTTINAQIGIQLGSPLAVVSTSTVGNVTGNIVSQNIYTPGQSAVGIFGVLVSGQDANALTATLEGANTATQNGLAPDENVIVQ